MLGAIIGDIVGSPYEFANISKFRKQPLFSPGCEFTDDTICTVAVAEARWGIPHDIKKRALSMLPEELVDVLLKFKSKFGYEI